MEFDLVLSSLEEEVRRWRGLAALEKETFRRDADLHKAATLLAAAEILGYLGSLDRRDSVPYSALKKEPMLSGKMVPQRFQKGACKETQP